MVDDRDNGSGCGGVCGLGAGGRRHIVKERGNRRCREQDGN